jgi:hypothetical protein
VEVNGEPACRKVSADGWDPLMARHHSARVSQPRQGRRVGVEAPPAQLGSPGERALVNELAEGDSHAEAAAHARGSAHGPGGGRRAAVPGNTRRGPGHHGCCVRPVRAHRRQPCAGPTARVRLGAVLGASTAQEPDAHLGRDVGCGEPCG